MLASTNETEQNKMTKSNLPKHLQAVLDKRDQKFKSLGLNKSPSDFLVECARKAEKNGDDNALIHGLIG